MHQEQKIILDREALKTLAADTRVTILKLLAERRATQTELAEQLSLSVPSVKEHLDELVLQNFVVVKSEGRKWKYYELTAKGRALLEPERHTIWIVLGTWLLGLVGGLAAVARNLWQTPVDTAQTLLAPAATEVVETEAQTTAADIVTTEIQRSAVDTATATVQPAAAKMVAEETATLATQTATTTSATNQWGWILYAVVMILLTAALVYFYFRKKNIIILRSRPQ